MNHSGFEVQLDLYLDGELAADDAREFEAHLAQCPECTRFRDQRLALRAAVLASAPSFAAPDALRDRIRTTLAASAREETRARRGPSESRWWRPLALAAALVLVALGSWNLAIRQAAGDRIEDDVLASHVRSLMPGHLTDVVSADQHTVKPWFNGRLDFSPPVHDFAAQGFPLMGGRLDYLDGHSAAALVYGRRQHLINVFLWPANRGSAGASWRGNRQGYHALHWTAADYTYWVVSDLGVAELQDFAHLVQQDGSPGALTTPR